MFTSVFIDFRKRKFIEIPFLTLLDCLLAGTSILNGWLWARFCATWSTSKLNNSSDCHHLLPFPSLYLRLVIRLELPGHLDQVCLRVYMWYGVEVLVDEVHEKLLIHILQFDRLPHHDNRIRLVLTFGLHLLFEKWWIINSWTISSLLSHIYFLTKIYSFQVSTVKAHFIRAISSIVTFGRLFYDNGNVFLVRFSVPCWWFIYDPFGCFLKFIVRLCLKVLLSLHFGCTNRLSCLSFLLYQGHLSFPFFLESVPSDMIAHPILDEHYCFPFLHHNFLDRRLQFYQFFLFFGV